MRRLAEELRQAAARTFLTEYQAKFEQTARALEEKACQLKHRRLDS